MSEEIDRHIYTGIAILTAGVYIQFGAGWAAIGCGAILLLLGIGAALRQ